MIPNLGNYNSKISQSLMKDANLTIKLMWWLSRPVARKKMKKVKLMVPQPSQVMP